MSPNKGSHLALSFVEKEREFFVDKLLVRIHFIIGLIRWSCHELWEFKFPFPGSLQPTFLVGKDPLSVRSS